MRLPTGSQRLDPRRIGRLVTAFVDRRRGALKDVALPRRLHVLGDALNRGRTGAYDLDALVAKLFHAAGRIAASVVIVPAAGMKRMALELLDSGYRGQLGPIQWTARHDDETSLEHVAAIGANRP